MPHYLDVERWPRRAAFAFFRDFDNPFFNVTVPLDVTAVREVCRLAEAPFSQAWLYLTLHVVNAYEPFRYRLDGDRVLVHDRIHASTTTLLEGDRLAFLYYDYDPDFATFCANAAAARRAVEAAPDGAEADIGDRASRTDVIHCSSLPWIAFTSISHARNWGGDDAIPKIAVGRYERHGERVTMPMSVEVHHALVDGLHVGRFFERLQALLADPAGLLG